MISLKGICQSKNYDLKIHGGIVSQIQGSSQSNQLGAFLGGGAVRHAQLGRWDLDLSFIYLNKTTPDRRINTYEGISLKGQTNFLFKILPMGDSFLYLGPGIAIHQPLNSSGDYNGPSFGANGKVMAPLKLSGILFYLTYDLDYLTGPGFWRNSVGIAFSPNF
ncbi:hypothetical protein [Algoriphagus sp.]|uniref:hypothetical protein n=1 Tax=Algoriphagus sp. TaxID=1872435 RepID=UPI002725C596|nr:hypothetical protein [Algoriphagus sp.]MDO8965455.1 hypothetical protein [Algoriphagus sp.]MDP3201494.1 hypothetical protein [Algoriphagus sp.]